ncbi:EXS-domain-containing protein [Durotheca rogersii]|uniref:EXS-domain-containing protein n=1 Tax=Durotheca rogersii TaxID=419775 RepID=UPI00221EB779|nr:EXS-domain-containing protein [Durotheca rogersii]KAI5867201.1 EXS-domain-containing protein [Durotheca rogersii]
MKFAKELEQDLVPEWRVKYLNYKAGKKYIKAVSRAISRASGTPRSLGRRGDASRRETVHLLGQAFRWPGLGGDSEPEESEAAGRGHELPRAQPSPIPIWTERQSLTASPGHERQYGSFVPTPPATAEAWNAFELPAPALMPVVPENSRAPGPALQPRPTEAPSNTVNPRRSASLSGEAVGAGPRPPILPRPSPREQQNPVPGRLRRIFSTGPYRANTENNKLEYDLQTIETVREREKDFSDFLDRELEKVETFYRQKEEQAGQRLQALREQLHEMRNRRTQEVAELKRQRESGENGNGHDGKGKLPAVNGSHGWVAPIKAKIFKPGANSKALLNSQFTPILDAVGAHARRDYTRRPPSQDVSYRTAKRKLKLALQEFYRGLELLQSYASLNRVAFRKLNKKYDKTVKARPPYRYMNEKVNTSWFVNSTTVDGYIHAVEDLYARYFEKGNRKIASGKLRRLNRRPRDRSDVAFESGLFIGTGAVFTLQGLVYSAKLLSDQDPSVVEQTRYLMQIYGGYFLILVLMFLFCLDCYVWTANKVNYPFIFEFDTRNNLDWRQLSAFPSFFFLLFGLFFWLNFLRYGGEELYIYWPVILIGVTLVILLLPLPILWHRSRQWIAYSHYRLFFAGLYPVEFRDFFLGDMYCSLTYATSNIELFFCLYANGWTNPNQCSSSNSRLLGFFSALPPVWRALQCIRRYYDTGNVFPHLVNGGKYGMTIMSAVTLSLYRMWGTESNFGLFVTFSAINSIYTSIWDLFMDFSFFQPDTRHRFLRDILALKRRRMYYCVMVLDPILRFSWIFYTIFAYDKQHSTAATFLICLAEVIRRGIWALFRVENEHCTNVAQYKASRDIPLPYRLDHEPLIERAGTEEEGNQRRGTTGSASSLFPDGTATVSAVDCGSASAHAQDHAQEQEDAQTSSSNGGIRWRRKHEMVHARSIRDVMAEAHRQDFEKRRRPSELGTSGGGGGGLVSTIQSEDEEEDEDEDEDEETGSITDERMQVRQEGLVTPETGERRT